jgi:hypothetical protein
VLSKINEFVESSGLNKIICKTFQRGLQTVSTRSAYINNKLYFRSWRIDAHDRLTKISQAYNAGHPIKGSKSVLDLYA